jgi:predicted Zn-dependent peptidase
MAYLSPARQSLDRLQARAGLLERLAAGGKASADVLEKVSATIEADLKTLSSEAELKALREADRAQAVQVRERVQAALEAVRKLAAGQD